MLNLCSMPRARLEAMEGGWGSVCQSGRGKAGGGGHSVVVHHPRSMAVKGVPRPPPLPGVNCHRGIVDPDPSAWRLTFYPFTFTEECRNRQRGRGPRFALDATRDLA